MDRKSIIAQIEQIVGRNAERNRKIVYDKLINGMTYEQVAEKYELSDRQIKNIVYKFKA